jgi:pyridoxamine 5'-phosphate oxidase
MNQNISQNIADLRQNYTFAGLREHEAKDNPLEQFKIWFQQALELELLEPNAMTLATVNPQGQPSARMVLLKDLDERGFVFYTNYNSQKGQHLAENPFAALVFWWDKLERQVRVEGAIEKVLPEESDQYFQSRPLNSQLGACVSPQSQIIENREFLEKNLTKLTQEYQNKKLSRPENWGGFRVIPKVIEFWQGRPSRLHDRLRYKLSANNTWIRERLAP